MLARWVSGLGLIFFVALGVLLQATQEIFFLTDDGRLTFRFRGLPLIGVCALGAGSLALLQLPFLRRWVQGGEKCSRLFLYLSWVALGLSLTILLFPAWMPFPLDLGAATLFLGSILGAAYWWRYRFKKLILVIVGACVGLLLPVAFITQVPKIKNAFPESLTSLPPIAEQVRIGKVMFFDALDETGLSLLVALQNDEIPKNSRIDTIRLRVPRNSIQEMAARLPSSAKERYSEAQMLYPDGQWKDIKYRFRGRNIWHWLPQKPSLRLRLKRSSPVDLQRHINLVNPEDRAMVRNILGEVVAQDLGVLTHVSSFVRLFINDKFFGVYHRTTREDEEMLRLNERIPGPIFIGDYLNDPWKAEDFETAGNLDVLKNVSPMTEMIDAISKPLGVERYSALWDVISLEKLSQWHAAMQLVGSFHTDYTHNNLFYFDPRMGLLEPIVSDVNGHGMLTFPGGQWRHFTNDRGRPVVRKGDVVMPLGERLTPLLDVALKDPRFQHARNKALYEALVTGQSSENQIDWLEEHVGQIRGDVYADRNKASLEALVNGRFRQLYTNAQFEQDVSELTRWIKKREEYLLSELLQHDVRIELSEDGPDVLARVEVTGNSAVELDLAAIRWSVWADSSLDGTFIRPTTGTQLLHPGLEENSDYHYLPTNKRRVPEHYLTAGSQSYLFKIMGASAQDAKLELSDLFSSALSGQSIKPTVEVVPTYRPSRVRYNKTGVHIWEMESETSCESFTFKEGRHQFKKSLFIPKSCTAIIEAGAHITMHPGVSIIAEGKVVIEGTPLNPVTINRHYSNDAWGGILLLGKGATKSQFRNLHISGGSFPRYKNVQASGMISVYGVPHFRLENSVVESNVTSDDTLHVVYGEPFVRNSSFTDCNADCIDFDYTEAVVEKLTVVDAGNDGLDLMTSRASITGFSARGVMDKGISIGERSEVNASDVQIERAGTGIAVKDKSRLLMSNAAIANSNVGIDIFRKNWRYGGAGSAAVLKTNFSGNGIDVQALDDGVIQVDHESIPSTVVGSGRMLILE